MTVPAHDRMTVANQRRTAPDDPAVTAARSTVQLARRRLERIRREHLAGHAGRADVATAEAALSRALDQLDRAAGTGWRT